MSRNVTDRRGRAKATFFSNVCLSVSLPDPGVSPRFSSSRVAADAKNNTPRKRRKWQTMTLTSMREFSYKKKPWLLVTYRDLHLTCRRVAKTIHPFIPPHPPLFEDNVNCSYSILTRTRA